MLCSANTPDLRNLGMQILQKEIGVQPCGDFQAIFWVGEGNKIEWVVGYTAFIGKTCQMHVINLVESYTPKGLLFGAFDFPFNYLGVEKIIAIVNSLNTRAMNYDKKLGFTEVVRLEGMHDDGGDLVVLEMNKADCRWIRERVKHETELVS